MLVLMPSSCARLASAPDRQGPTGLHRLQRRMGSRPHLRDPQARCIFAQPGYRNSSASESGAKFGFVLQGLPARVERASPPTQRQAAELVARRRENSRRLEGRVLHFLEWNRFHLGASYARRCPSPRCPSPISIDPDYPQLRVWKLP